MSNSFCIYQKTENGQNLSKKPIRNYLSNKCFSKQSKNNIFPLNKKLFNNKADIHSQILLNSENIISNDTSKYIHCKRHPENIISFFCETDRTFPCIKCINQHEEHLYKKCYCTKKYFEKEITKIKKLFEEVEIKYFQNKKSAEKFFSQIKTHFDKEIHKINDYFDSMITILQDKKSEFIAKMLIIYENYIKNFIKYKFIFDSCDKNYSNLNQKINYIENEVYKNDDFESFYNIKNIFINDINNFSKCNEENFRDKNIFCFNSNSMPIFVYPSKPIINISDNINLFGTFKNTGLNFNQNENDIKLFHDKNQNKEKNEFIDSINADNTFNNNINNIKSNETNVDIFLERNKNMNIITSINSGISNINDSFIEKQLIDTDSTLFFLNKNGVKNVFKQQDENIYRPIDKGELKINNNIEIKKSESPKNNNTNNINNKVKYTSCDKEMRNKQIIKKFLEKEDLIKENDKTRLTTKQFINKKNQSINYNLNYLTTFDNNSIHNTLNNDFLIKDKNINKSSKNKKKNYPPNNKAKYKQYNKMIQKKCCSITKSINDSNNQININSFNIDLKNSKSNNKKKKNIPNKKKINNINKYMNGSFEDGNLNNNKYNENMYFHRNVKDLYKDFNKKRKIKNTSFIRNRINVKSMKNIRNKLNYADNNVSIFHNKKHKSGSQICRFTDNYERRNSLSKIDINRSNSYRYYKNDFFNN